MFKKDNLYFGLLIGMFFPIIAFLLIKYEMGNIIDNKPLALYAIAALLNLAIMRYFYHFKLTHSAQGVVLMTFLIAMILVFYGEFRIG